MQNRRPSNVKVIFQRPSCRSPIAVASGFIASTAPVIWSEVQACTWPSCCHCHSLSLASVISRLVLPFWYWLTRIVPDEGPLNGCSSSALCGFWIASCLKRHYFLFTLLPCVHMFMTYYNCTICRLTLAKFFSISMPVDFCHHLVGKNSEKCLSL